MKSENRSQAFLRKRKMMLVLPLLVSPFLTMAFWALGGGSGAEPKAAAQQTGLNLALPSANLKEDGGDGKLSFYDRAQKDSAKRKEWMEADPYYRNLPDSAVELPARLEEPPSGTAPKYQPLASTPFAAEGQNPEEKLMQKLAALQKELDKPASKTASTTAAHHQKLPDGFPLHTKQLQTTMEATGTGSEEDPEIKQLSTALDKILDIQHPDRVKERLKERSLQNKRQVFRVAEYKPGAPISLLTEQEEKSSRAGNAFFGEQATTSSTAAEENAVPAVIHGTQTVTSGATVKLRLLSDVFIGGKVVPKGTFVYGVASQDGGRLLIPITIIRSGDNLLPVSLTVYDLDGLAGIHVPGSVSGEVARQSLDQSLGNIGLLSVDPSLKAQAASEGIKAAKSLLSKNVKQVKMTLKAGYRVLLRDSHGDE